jgi:phosphohistidine phosphatase
MKTLLLVRHAKTQTESESGKDFDRMLTDRGNKDAAHMAQRLHEQKVHLDALVTSTAKRAMETAQYFLKQYKGDGTVLVEEPGLYDAAPPAYHHIIEALDDKWKRVALFAHNPGITDMANKLEVAHVDSMPTAGVFAITADTTEWKDFDKAEKRFLFFDFPKMQEEGDKK